MRWAGAHLHARGLMLNVTEGQQTPGTPWWPRAVNYARVEFPGKGFSPGTFLLKCIAFSHSFSLVFSFLCWKRENFSSSFGFRVEFKQVFP